MTYRAPGFKTTKKAHLDFQKQIFKKYLLLHIIK